MAKKQIAIRASQATINKLKKLQETHGTQTEVLAVAIDRMHKAECDRTAQDKEPAK